MPERSRLKKFVHNLGVKEWSEADVQKYVGTFSDACLAYAADAEIRKKSASGGVVSALVISMLESGQADGALLLKSKVENGVVLPEFFIATTRAEVLAARGSKYTAVNFYQDAYPLIKAFKGRLAVVALPCDAMVLGRICEKEADVTEKIVATIGLFCGHNSQPALTEKIITDIEKAEGKKVESFAYRTGHWRGNLSATLESGKVVEKPFSTFSDYQNLYFFAQPKCHSCHDHFAYHADIAVGDIWLYHMKDEPIKHSSVIARTARGAAILKSAMKTKVIQKREAPIQTIMDGQSRTMPFHYCTAARAKAGKWLGIKVKDSTGAKLHFSHLVVAVIALGNEKFSRTRIGQKIIFLIPRPLLRAYLYLMKGLELF